jgi:hypothetical protein
MSTSAGASGGFFPGELCCAMRVGPFAGEFCCDVVESSMFIFGLEGEACSFSAMRLLLLAVVILMATSLALLAMGILSTARKR